nr:hypothetical protein GCM10020185_52350 [Pseudomonas brassicacearum subsp. brassicacearum]
MKNLPVGQKLLAALLVLLTTVLLVANLTFISAAYYISQESMAPQALQTIGRLVANPSLISDALQSPQSAQRLLDELNSYAPLRAAALYDGQGERLAQLQHAEKNSSCRTITAICRLGRPVNSAATRSLPCPAPARCPVICCW